MRSYPCSVERPDTFWLKLDDYRVVSEAHSLEELLSSLRKVDSVSHHLTKRQNDFAVWIERVICDRHLAERVRNIQPGPEALPTLIREIEERLSMFDP